MYTINSNSGKVSHGIKKFIVDTVDDIFELPIADTAAGSTAFVIENSTYYMLNNQKQWKKVNLGTSGGGSGGGSDTPVLPDEIIYDGGIV